MPKGIKGSSPQCAVKGCPSKSSVRGMCSAHYNRLQRYGDPLAGHPFKFQAVPWLRDAVATRDRSECWEWPFGKISTGYGLVTFNKRRELATHVALLLDGKPPPPPPSNHALHSCDNPGCVNPAHLSWGTNGDNIADRMAKGRSYAGERHAWTKLTEVDVRAIKQDTRSASEIGPEYGVTASNISAIRRGVSWKNV